jgi:hypothetical protein
MKSFPACAGGIRSPGTPRNKFGSVSPSENSRCQMPFGWTNGARAFEFSARRGSVEKPISTNTSNMMALQRKTKKHEAP